MKEQLFALLNEGDLQTIISLKPPPEILLERNEQGQSVFHHAANRGHLQIVEYFVQLAKRGNLSIDLLDKKNKTALHHAAQSGHTEVAMLLVREGASTGAKNIAAQTPLHYAVFTGDLPLVIFLIENGAPVTQKNIDGQAAVHYAAQNGNIEIMKYLLSHNGSVNEYTNDKSLPLHFAIAYQHAAMVSFLLESKSVAPISALDLADESTSEIQGILDDYIAPESERVKVPRRRKPSLSVNVNSPFFPSVLITPQTPRESLDQSQ